jgi:hypothetical protein
MKTLLINFRSIHALFCKLFILIIYFLSIPSAQPQISEITDIYLPYRNYPDLGSINGSMAVDMIYAYNKLFVYTINGIKIYNPNTSQPEFLGQVNFDGIDQYGKFNPIYLNQRVNFGDNHLMAYNSSQQILYVVFPNL